MYVKNVSKNSDLKTFLSFAEEENHKRELTTRFAADNEPFERDFTVGANNRKIIELMKTFMFELRE